LQAGTAINSFAFAVLFARSASRRFFVFPSAKDFPTLVAESPLFSIHACFLKNLEIILPAIFASSRKYRAKKPSFARRFPARETRSSQNESGLIFEG